MASPENIQTIVFANTAEAFSAPISYINDPTQRQERIRIENVLSQRAFFWERDNKLIVTPTEIPTALLEHNSNVLGLNHVVNRSPRYRTHSLCGNILYDNDFLQELIESMRINPGTKVTAYAYTPELHTLVQRLQGENINFVPTEQLAGDISIVPFLDSKSGFRRVLSSIDGVVLPSGFICSDLNEVQARIADFQSRNTPFVVKANEGESGWGLFIGKGNDPGIVNQLAEQSTRDGIWKSVPYIIEEYIDLDKSRGGGSPSTELYVASDTAEITYNCAQLFDKEGEFSGIALGNGILDVDLQHRMERMAVTIGRKYQELGYRGFFDIDFAVSNDNQLYALETNTRRTGGTHVYDLARGLFGNDWNNHLFYSNDAFNYGHNPIDATEILEKLKDILFPIQGKDEGLVVSLLDQSRPIMGYVLIVANRQSINKLESTLLDIFPAR